MKYIFFILITFFIFVIGPSLTFAQTESFAVGDLFDFSKIKLPTEIQDLFKTAGKVQESVKNTQVVQQITDQVKECVTNGGTANCVDIKNPSDAIESVRGIFSKINNWFQNTIGVSFSEIIRAIGNFFVWTLKWVVEFLQTMLSKL